jgi:hypothetical protein
MNCQYFSRGFLTAEAREHHVDRHERAFLCVLEGCPFRPFGYATLKELEEHMAELYGIEVSNDLEFPDLRTIAKVRQKHPSIYQCTLCPKKFTRSFNLHAHLTTHDNEKPFVCSLCGLALARNNDRIRHEKGHSDQKCFIRRGTLAGGGEWGCGSQFPRADKLADHQKSAVGLRRIKPLLDEEEEAKRKHIADQMATIDSVPDNEGALCSEGILPDVSEVPECLEVERPGDQLSKSPAAAEGSPYSISTPKSQHRIRDRVYCNSCKEYPEGFRGEHELRRHQDRKHKRIVRKWICVTPNGGNILWPRPLIELSRCRSCNRRRLYGESYKAAAHLRRVHFKQFGYGTNDVKRGGKYAGKRPTMEELKPWLMEITQNIVDGEPQELGESEDDDDDYS